MLKKYAMAVLMLAVVGSAECLAYGYAKGVSYAVVGWKYDAVQKRYVAKFASKSRTCDAQHDNQLVRERAAAVAKRGTYEYNSAGAYRASIENFAPRCH